MTPARSATVALLVLAALTACGSDQDRYCDAVESHQEELSGIAAEEGRVFDSLPIWRDLQQQAPRDIEAEWGVVVDALEGLHDVVEAAGVDEDYDAEDPPPGVSEDQQQAISRAAARLGGERVVTAMASLEQHALDVCGTPLSR